MLKHPDTQPANSSPGKLVLPAPNEEQHVSSDQHSAPIYPGQLIRQKTSPAPKGTLPKLAWYWRKDPAYKVFMIALVMVILAAAVFISLGGASLFGLSLFGSSYPQNAPANVAPGGKVDLQPTFPKPGGGQGSNQNSQPPAQQTPSFGPTATGGTQPGGSSAVQITYYTPFVTNGNRAVVTVSTNQPGMTVSLQVRYSQQASGGRPATQITDGNGNATFIWIVYVAGFGHKNAQAVVTAVASDQNGQRAFSNTVTIQIMPGYPIV